MFTQKVNLTKKHEKRQHLILNCCIIFCKRKLECMQHFFRCCSKSKFSLRNSGKFAEAFKTILLQLQNLPLPQRYFSQNRFTKSMEVKLLTKSQEYDAWSNKRACIWMMTFECRSYP